MDDTVEPNHCADVRGDSSLAHGDSDVVDVIRERAGAAFIQLGEGVFDLVRYNDQLVVLADI